MLHYGNNGERGGKAGGLSLFCCIRNRNYVVFYIKKRLGRNDPYILLTIRYVLNIF